MSESEVSDPDQRNAIITTITLDISNKHLKEIPKTIKNFSNIEFLYLSTNDIKTIPDSFFLCLPQLKWLDFRHNLLTGLPTTIGQHRELRTLLLQGNKIIALPIELGNVPTITGLNIAGNPLEYPPAAILQEGSQNILKFLRVELQSENLLIPELEEQLEEMQLAENEGLYLGTGDEDVQNTISVPVLRKTNRNQVQDSPLSHKSAKLVPRSQDRRFSYSDTMITTKAKLPRKKKKDKSQTTSAKMPHSDYYIKKISQAMEDYEEKRMQAIKKEENSRTEMMIQRMRDREALKMWRQQTFTNGNSAAVHNLDGNFPKLPRENAYHRLVRTSEMQPKFDDIIGYINTQITVLKARQERLLNTFDSSQNPEVEKLRMVIERKQMELMELHRRDIADRSTGGSKSQVFMKNRSLDQVRPLRQKTVAMTDKEAELRRKIKEHATKLKEYHRDKPGTTGETVIDLKESEVLHNKVRQMNQEYRFRAFTGEVLD